MNKEKRICGGIEVAVHIPENVNERTRREKINRIYDILTRNI